MCPPMIPVLVCGTGAAARKGTAQIGAGGKILLLGFWAVVVCPPEVRLSGLRNFRKNRFRRRLFLFAGLSL